MRELKRVLKKSGVIFWNMGDCYGSHRDWNWSDIPLKKQLANGGKQQGIKGYEKCLMLQNWRFIIRCIDELGLILRNSIIWYKPNAMPSSVRDRFANKYEPVFMLVKNKKYWFDLDAVRIPHQSGNYAGFNTEYEYRMNLRKDKTYQHHSPYTQKIGENKYAKGSEFVKKYGEPWDRFHKWGKQKQTSIPQDQAESFGSPRARYWRKGRGSNNPALNNRNFMPIKNIDPRGNDKGGPGSWRTKLDDKEYRKNWRKNKYTSDYVAPVGPSMGIDRMRQEWCSRTPNWSNIKGKNLGDVWTISTQPCPKDFRGEHFATFPEKLIEPMILAGCPKEICKKCGKARERITKIFYDKEHPTYNEWLKKQNPNTMYKGKGITVGGYGSEVSRYYKEVWNTDRSVKQTIGFTKCNCENPEYEAGICLDPFMGLGTVGVVAKRLKRNFIGIDLKEEYCKMAEQRIKNQAQPLL